VSGQSHPTNTGPESFESVAPATGPASEAGGTTYGSADLGSGATYGDSGSYADSGSASSTADVAKGEAGAVKDTAVQAGRQVASTAKDEAANVAQEAGQQVRGLLDTVTTELRDQAGSQQQRIASAVHSLSKELGGMASASDGSGPLTDLAHKAAARGGEVAHWLENREPRDVLEEVRSFGRRRPVAFLGLCLAAGVAVGRLARGAVAANTELDSPNTGSGGGQGHAALPSGSPTYQQPISNVPATGPIDTGVTQPLGDAPIAPPGPAYVGPTGTGAPATGYGTGVPETGTGHGMVGPGTSGGFDDPLAAPQPGQPRPDEFR
jgi:hypothetical protein